MGGGDVQRGRVLILNGGSSSGKTTLARILQSALPEPWLLLGIDLFIWALPPDMVNGPGGLSIRDGVITRGEPFMSLYAGYRNAVATVAHSGVNVLLDDLTLDGVVDQQRWDESLRDLDVCWIGVRCAPDLAAEREARRGSRPSGIARVQAESVHQGVRYEVEVDTGVLDPSDAMNAIAEAMARRWPSSVPPQPDHESTFPRTSAWTSEGARPQPPWEA
jgi:chloramphenicol 3-O phosphotransferase